MQLVSLCVPPRHPVCSSPRPFARKMSIDTALCLRPELWGLWYCYKPVFQRHFLATKSSKVFGRNLLLLLSAGSRIFSGQVLILLLFYIEAWGVVIFFALWVEYEQAIHGNKHYNYSLHQVYTRPAVLNGNLIQGLQKVFLLSTPLWQGVSKLEMQLVKMSV